MKYFLIFTLIFMTFMSHAYEINDPSLAHGQFENGFNYVIKPNVDEGDDKVYFALIVNTGSYNEEDDQRGYAHVLEHAMFRSQTAVDDPFTFFAEKGGSVNALTLFHETVYMPSVRQGDEQYALDFLSDIATNLNIDDVGLKLDQEIVLNEFNTSGNPHVDVSPYLNEFYFGRQNRYLKRLPIGTKKSLLEINVEAVSRFYNDWYHPQNMTLLVVGDINSEEMVKQINKSFSGIEKTGKLKKEKPIVKPRNTTYNSAINVDEVFVSQEYIFNSSSDRKIKEFELIQYNLLTMLIKDDLDALIKNYDLPFNESYVKYIEFGYGELLSLTIELSEVDATDQLENTVSFLEKYKLKLINDGFSQEKINEFKTIFLNDIEVELKSPFVKKSNFLYSVYLNALMNEERIDSIEDSLVIIDTYLNTITPEILKSNMKALFGSSTSTQVVFDSGAKIRQPTIEKWQEQAKTEFQEHGLKLTKKEEIKTDVYSLPTKVKSDLSINNIQSAFLDHPIKSWTLKNGITVNYIYQPNDANQTYMLFTTHVREVDLEPNLRIPLVNYSYIQIVTGLKGLSFDEMSQQFSKNKMGLSSLHGLPSFYGLAEHDQLNVLGDYMHRMLAEPIIDQPKTIEVIDSLKENFTSSQQSFSWLSEKNRVTHLFGSSPYYSAITVDDAQKQLTVENIEKLRKVLVSKEAKPTFLITGELSEQDAIELSEKYFANIQTNEDKNLLKKSPIENIPLPKPGRFNIGFNEIQYDNIIMYFASKALVKSDKNIDQMKLFNYLFGTYIFDEMREKRGLIYSPSTTYSFKDRFMPFGFFYVNFQADVLNEDEFYGMFDEVLDEFFNKEITLEELDNAKSALKVEVQAEITLPTILNVFLNDYQDDFSFDRYYENKGVDGLTLDEVNAFKQIIKNDYVRTTLTTYPR
ncbi:M16 family metallopeptidase [Marinicellulosiphila megalodicopiae]|uniref:M16 family metallopeptidase n=1 Tax=Marinicellulosiphila megalodicopiae TaxID=2724896 RepID=UPI003BAFE86B